MYDIVVQLRKQAQEIAKAGHNGWGNTMSDAADEIERLRAAQPSVQADLPQATHNEPDSLGMDIADPTPDSP